MPFHKKRLVRESEWARIYELSDPQGQLFESKFLVDALHVSPSVIREKWARLSEDEKVELASAFSAQPPRDADDQQILQFLMEVGPEEVWKSIAIVSTFHPDKEYALQFLLERIRRAEERSANYYQALQLLRRPEAIPILRQCYDEYRTRVVAKVGRPRETDFWVEYLQCTKTLLTLTQDPTFLASLNEAQVIAPLELRAYVANVLREIENS